MDNLENKSTAERLNRLEVRFDELHKKCLLLEIERNGANGFTFSDRQDKRIREIIHDEGFIQVGRVTVRGLLLALGTGASVAFAAVLAYFGLKH